MSTIGTRTNHSGTSPSGTSPSGTSPSGTSPSGTSRPNKHRSQTIHLETVLPAPVERVWSLMCYPATFGYLVRGLFSMPALIGRVEPFVPGESGSGWLFAFHLVPAWRHTITVLDVDSSTHTVRTHEHGGMLRAWDHTLHVEPMDADTARDADTSGNDSLANDTPGNDTARYSDTVVIDAGRLTPMVALVARAIYRYRHRRWRLLLARNAPAWR